MHNPDMIVEVPATTMQMVHADGSWSIFTPQAIETFDLTPRVT